MRYSAEDDSLKLTTYGGGDPLEVTKDVSLDLVDTRLYFKTRVSNGDDLADFAILLSNNNWTQQAEYNLQHGVYGVDDIIHDNEWYHFALGESLSRNPHFGAWRLSDASFDWSNIDKVRIVAQSEIGRSVTIDIKDFATAPEQSEEQVVILFDDGWASVLGAAEIMHKYDIKGNVPVITSAIGRERYLTLDDLKKLQNDYGWNIVNHTNLHKNAVAEYVKKDNFEGYEHDVTDALVYLLQNDLNSAPNWFVYPNGKTDPTTEAFVRQYYTFARSTVDGAETFPFPEPHEVKILSIYTNEATMDDVFGALEDAKRFNQTVMLMFHKFSDGTSSVFTEWELSDFEKVIEYIHENDINVSTLSELDAINGVPESEFTLQEFEAPQFTLDVAVDKKWPIFDRMAQWLQR